MIVEFLPEASGEVEDAVDYYNGQRPRLGEQFRAEVGAAVERVVAFPEGWAPLSRRLRRCRLHRFPYGIIYQIRPDRILVVAVVHLKRRPGYWRDHLN